MTKMGDIQLPVGHQVAVRRLWVGLACAIILLAAAFAAIKLLAADTVASDSLWLEPVRKGALDRRVAGFGELAPETIIDITTHAGGTVKSIVAKAGAHVNEGDPLADLFNAGLTQQLASAKRDYLDKETDFLTQKYSGQKQAAQARKEVRELAQNAELLQFKLRAQKRLYASHIISELDFMQTQAEQKSNRLALADAQRNVDIVESLERKLNQQRDAALKLSTDAVDAMASQVAGLTLRAPHEGLVYQVTDGLTVGSNVQSGQEVAKLVVGDGLIAEMQVDAAQAASIEPGMKAKLTIASESVRGQVIQVAPRAIQDRVEIRIRLDRKVDGNFRAGDPVTGEILTGAMGDRVYVHAPPGIEPNTTSNVFVQKDSDPTYLVRRKVLFGNKVGTQLIVKDGLTPGEQVVMSDLSTYKDERRLKVSQ